MVRRWSVIEFGKAQIASLLLNFGAEQAACIEHNPHGLTAFDFENAGSELVAAGRGSPADVAEVVALAIVAEAFEFAALAALAVPALFHFNLSAADQVERMLASLFEIGENPHGLRNVRGGPAFSKTKIGLITEKQTAHSHVAAFARENLVARP